MSSPTIQILGKRFNPYIGRDRIVERTAELGRDISAAYVDAVDERSPLVLLSVLNGAFMFMADLCREIRIPNEIVFTRLSSYHGGTSTSGRVEQPMPIQAELRGRHVLIVEDIVDSGFSLSYLLEEVRREEPASVATVALLHKKEAARVEVPLEYVGFEIPDAFVVGYGMDYAELGRNLPDIHALSD